MKRFDYPKSNLFENMASTEFHGSANFGASRQRAADHPSVKKSLQTRSPIPEWATEKVKEAWNIH
jgi:hypothetical protein